MTAQVVEGEIPSVTFSLSKVQEPSVIMSFL